MSVIERFLRLRSSALVAGCLLTLHGQLITLSLKFPTDAHRSMLVVSDMTTQ